MGSLIGNDYDAGALSEEEKARRQVEAAIEHMIHVEEYQQAQAGVEERRQGLIREVRAMTEKAEE